MPSRPRHSAKPISRGAPLVGVQIGTSDSHSRGILEGVIRYAQRHTDWQFRWDGRYDYAFGHDGSVRCLIAEARDPVHVEALAKLDIPVVVVTGEAAAGHFPLVTTDEGPIFALALDHFRAIGLRRVAFVNLAPYGRRRPRGEAYRRWAQTEFPGEDPWVFEARWEVHDDPDHLAALSRWLARLPTPIGVFCHNDRVAYAVAAACALAGLRVPDQLAILGVDNDLFLCELAQPSLSSIDLNAHVLGQRAAQRMHHILGGEPPDLRPIRVPPVGVVARRSTQALLFDDPQAVEAIRTIRDRACDGLTVAELLAGVPVCRTTLDARLRRCLGRTAREEILRVRLDRARTLLATTDLAMPAIADRCGFAYASQFSTTFRREVGVTPGAYRQSHAPTPA